MGVIGHARLPHITPQTLSPLHSHLVTAHSATRVSNWSVTIRTLRSVPSPSTTTTTTASSSSSSSPTSTVPQELDPEDGPSSSTALAQERARKRARIERSKLMHCITTSDYSNSEKMMVIVDDATLETRGQRRNRLANDIAQRLVLGEKMREAGLGESEAEMAAEVIVGGEGAETLEGVGGGEGQGKGKGQDDVALHGGTKETKVTPSSGAQPSAPDATTIETSTSDTDAPTRYTLFMASTSLYSQLTASSKKDMGFGIWQVRGGVINIEGSEWQLRRSNMLGDVALKSAPSQAQSQLAAGSGAMDRDGEDRYEVGAKGIEKQAHDWSVRIGCIQAGGAPRGAVIEAEFHPLLSLPSSSPLLTTFLSTLFPPYLLIPPNAPPSSLAPLILDAPPENLWTEVGISDSDSGSDSEIGEGWMGLRRRKRLGCAWIALCKEAGVL